MAVVLHLISPLKKNDQISLTGAVHIFIGFNFFFIDDRINSGIDFGFFCEDFISETMMTE